jgi:hypothetical protein
MLWLKSLTLSILSVLILSLNAQAWSGDRPQITAIKGDGAKVTGWTGDQRTAKEGETLELGEVIETDKKTTVLLTYPDASRAILSPNSKFEVKAKENGAEVNDLSKGSVRGIINKNKTTNRHNYIFKNKAAVMGVRGTDFVMSFDGVANSDVHVIEGLVDLATDSKNLVSGSFSPLKAGEFMGSGTRGLSQASSFDSKKFAKDLESKEMSVSSYGIDPNRVFELPEKKYPFQDAAFWRFRVGGHYIFQSKSKGWSYTGIVSWNPRFLLNERWALIADAGIFPLRLGTANEWILAYRAGAGLSWGWGQHLSIEGGLGREDWGNYTLAGFEYFANIRYKLNESVRIKGIVIGFNYYDRPTFPYDPALNYHASLEFGL